VKIITDSTNAIAETNENDNQYIKTINVVAPAPTQVGGSGTINGRSGLASLTIQGVGKVAGRKGKTTITGGFSYSDPAVPLNFSAKKITSLTITGNQASFGGTAKIPKTSVARAQNITFTVSATDNGVPGTNDTFSISVSNGYSAIGNLTSGDILVH
jgi:hypothetical protein